MADSWTDTHGTVEWLDGCIEWMDLDGMSARKNNIRETNDDDVVDDEDEDTTWN